MLKENGNRKKHGAKNNGSGKRHSAKNNGSEKRHSAKKNANRKKPDRLNVAVKKKSAVFYSKRNEKNRPAEIRLSTASTMVKNSRQRLSSRSFAR